MNRWEDTGSDSIVVAEILMLMILLIMGRRADGQMSIREDTEDAAAYAAEYTDADADADDAADADNTSDAADETMRRY